MIMNDKTSFQLLDISKKSYVEVKRFRMLITEITNPVFMEDIFHYCQSKSHKAIKVLTFGIPYRKI